MKKILVFLAALGLVAKVSFASTTVQYTSIPDPMPGNVPSMGAEAYAFQELGGLIQLNSTEGTNPIVTVMMSSWACEQGHWYDSTCITTEGATFSAPITLNLYNVNEDNTQGTQFATVTKTFDMPYRPSTDTINCTGGKWYDGTTCFNGKGFTIDFDLGNITLPNKFIVGVNYNTSHYGPSPLGESTECYTSSGGCFYDSLNIGLTGLPTVGTNPLPDVIYENGSIVTGYEGYQPTIKVTLSDPQITPTTKDQCKKDGWKTFNSPVFKNQGDCVSWIQSNPKAIGNKNK